MAEINRIPKRWINQPNGVAGLNADGDLEGPIILRDIKDPATGGGPEDVPAANEIVVVRGNLAVGKNGTTWTPYAPLEVAMDAVAFQNRTTNGISFTAEYIGESVTVVVYPTTPMGQFKVVWSDRTVTTHVDGAVATWSGETAGSLPIELVPVNDTIREVIFGGYYVNDLKCSHLPDLFSLNIAKSKMRVLDLRGCSGLKRLWLQDVFPDGPKSDVRTILLDPAIVWESVVLDLDDYGDVDISDWRWGVGGYGSQNLLKGRTICGHLNLAGWTSESYFFEANQTRISEVTMPASVAGFAINNSELRKINGGEDLQMIYGEGSLLDLSGNQLSAEELDAFFERLPTQTAPECNLWVMDNPGAATCHPLIAQAKGFIVNVI